MGSHRVGHNWMTNTHTQSWNRRWKAFVLLLMSSPRVLPWFVEQILSDCSNAPWACVLWCVWFRSPMDCAHEAPLRMGFPRQEYWSGLPFPNPGDLPDAGIEPGSPALQAFSLPSEPPGKPGRCVLLTSFRWWFYGLVHFMVKKVTLQLNWFSL